MDWRHQSACRDEDPELFFPVGNTGPALTQIEEAKKVCNRCIVKEPCLAWALEIDHPNFENSLPFILVFVRCTEDN